ncbi:hypothetical protein [Nitrosomonas marina]|uniref:hypothetical protein n=1 Tax=Nitrosomonas marina TaxID=917 RepID=UPI000B807AB4|nr:hypothetical protein [Nitrosomonas marina]
MVLYKNGVLLNRQGQGRSAQRATGCSLHSNPQPGQSDGMFVGLTVVTLLTLVFSRHYLYHLRLSFLFK